MSGQMPLFGTTDSKPSKRVAARVEEIVGEGFDVKKFVENFEVLAKADQGLMRLRQLVVELAVRGRLSLSNTHEETAEDLLERITEEVGKHGTKHGPVEEHEIPFPIPHHWMWVRWGRLVTSTSSGWSPQCESHPRGDGEWGVLKVSAVSWTKFNANENKALPEGVEPRPEFSIHTGDFLMSRANTAELVGRSVIVEGPVERLLLSDKIVRCHFSRWMDKHFAALYNRSFAARSHYVTHASGTSDSMKNISRDVILSMPVPLPPAAEQKRIVAKVDQLMALCDDLEARQTKKREIGTRLTKSALEALTTAEGPEEFDAAWKRVVENFDVLIDRTEKLTDLRRHLLQLAVTGALSPSGASTWKQGRIADVADCRLGKMLDKAKNRGTPLPYLRNTNVHWFRLELGDIKHMLFEDNELEEYELRAGDLVVCEGGHGIGRTAVWKGDLRPMMFQKALHRLRPRPTMNSDFLAYQIKVASDTGVMNRYFTGTGIPHLTGRRLAEMEVTIPPFEEQRRIVARVERLMNVCSDLEAQLRRTEDRAGKLAEAVVQALVT